MFSLGWSQSGCGTGSVGVPIDGVEDGNRDAGAVSTVGRTRGEPNDDFADAIVAVFDAAGGANLQGTVSSVDDVDVFRLGGLMAGDRIVIDVATSSSASSLDPAIGLFDADQNMVAYNDDLFATLDSFLDFVVRHDSDPYYLVVSRSQLATFARQRGSYAVDIRRTVGGSVPAPVMQTFFSISTAERSRLPTLVLSRRRPLMRVRSTLCMRARRRR